MYRFAPLPVIVMLLALPVQAYTTYGDVWAKTEITYAFDTNVPAYAKPVVAASFYQWSHAAFRDTVKFLEAATAPDIRIHWSVGDLIVGGQHADGATTHAATNHVITSGSITINGSIDWTKPTPFGDSLVSLSLHEIGHVLGLGHSDASAAVMNPANIITSLQKDDLDGIASLYTVPPSDRALLIATLTRLRQAYTVPAKIKIPKPLYGYPLAVVQVGSAMFYFDAVNESYIGLLSRGKFSFKTP